MDKTKVLAVLQETFGTAVMYWSLGVAVLAAAAVRAHFTDNGWAAFLQDEWEVTALAVVIAGLLVRFMRPRKPAEPAEPEAPTGAVPPRKILEP
jgi:hypothetical protein